RPAGPDDPVDPVLPVDPLLPVDELELLEDADSPTTEFPSVASLPTATLTSVTTPAPGAVRVASVTLLCAVCSDKLADSSVASSASIVAFSLPSSSATVF